LHDGLVGDVSHRTIGPARDNRTVGQRTPAPAAPSLIDALRPAGKEQK
jgi:hypothetical protein